MFCVWFFCGLGVVDCVVIVVWRLLGFKRVWILQFFGIYFGWGVRTNNGKSNGDRLVAPALPALEPSAERWPLRGGL